MKNFKLIISLFLITIAFVSCDSNDSNSSSQNDTAFAENFGASVARDFIGQVVDVDNHPIQNVSIKIGTSTVQTDVNGVFIINGAPVHEKFAYITAKKTGFIDGSRAMVPTSGKNNVKIMLLPNTPLQTIQSGQTSEVSIYSGTKVVFDGAFQDENGATYSGDVQVALFHLTPSDENIDKLMPGMLYAQTQNNKEAVLETYGMLNVELRGSAGQKLNIASGHTAEITIRIDDSQIATAPNSIPLWHFDEAKGYWKEDGTATKVGNKYVGEVSHFSWWNCDTFSSVVTLTVTVVDSNGNLLSNVGVGLVVNSSNFNSYVQYTDNNGQVSGLIPANQTLTLNVYTSYSNSGPNNIIYTTSIGPFLTSTTLPNIVINNSITTLSSNVMGTLVKCDNSNVTNGYVLLNRFGNYSLSPVTNGAFSFNEIYIPEDTAFTLKGFDIENLQQTDSINYNFTTPITTIGNLQACNAIDEFISYKIDNEPTVFLLQNLYGGANLSGTPAVISVSVPASSGVNFLIWGATVLPGIYSTDYFYIQEYQYFGYIGPNTINTIRFNLNQVGAVGEYIDMTFSGTYQDSNGSNHTLTGVAHVIRE
jgi:hypothetical protein